MGKKKKRAGKKQRKEANGGFLLKTVFLLFAVMMIPVLLFLDVGRQNRSNLRVRLEKIPNISPRRVEDDTALQIVDKSAGDPNGTIVNAANVANAPRQAVYLESVMDAFDSMTSSAKIPKSMVSPRRQKIGLKRDGNFYETMVKQFPKAKCFRTVKEDVNVDYIPPVFHGKSLTESIAANPRSQYKVLVDPHTDAAALKRSILLDPYQFLPNAQRDPSVGLCLVEKGYVSATGDVCTKYACIQSKSCAQSYGKSELFRLYRKAKAIFVLSEDQGYGFWHFMMENWIRLFTALDMLKKRTGILVHVVKSQLLFIRQAVSFLGIDESRIVSGRYVAATVVLPEPVWCGSPPLKLVHIARQQVFYRLPNLKKVKTILVIKRNGGRKVLNHRALVSSLRAKFSPAYHINTFTSATFKDTMALFHSSNLVIGPHGAGLSNIIACKAGTGIVEFLLQGKLLNLCYMFLATKLGLRYHGYTHRGITSKNKGMRVVVKTVLEIADEAILK